MKTASPKFKQWLKDNNYDKQTPEEYMLNKYIVEQYLQYLEEEVGYE